MPAAIVLTVIPAGFAFAKFDSRDVWCLDTNSLPRVIFAAEVLELPVEVGKNSLMLSLNGSNVDISLKNWRRQSPADFRKACDAAYEAYMGVAPAPAAPRDDDESFLAELGLASLPALFGAVVGAIGGYFASKFSRAEERRRQEAAGLRANLGGLSADVKAFADTVRADGLIQPASRVAVQRRAIELGASVRPSADQADAATTALSELIAALSSTKTGTVAAQAINSALGTVESAVNALIVETEPGR